MHFDVRNIPDSELLQELLDPDFYLLANCSSLTQERIDMLLSLTWKLTPEERYFLQDNYLDCAEKGEEIFNEIIDGIRDSLFD